MSVSTDIDECKEDTDICDANADCNNTAGGHKCICKKGYQMSDDDVCEDADECETGDHDCKEKNAACKNIAGGFTCYCEAGYQVNDDGICEGIFN